MSKNVVFAVAALAFGLSLGEARAESNGNGAPFVFQAEPQITNGLPFVSDTGTEAYPTMTGNTAQPSSFAQLEPTAGSEGPVQVANSLPAGFGHGTVAYAQAQSVSRYHATRARTGRVIEAGQLLPRG